MLYGYIRVSSSTQNVSRQVEKMSALGITEPFIDHASGKDMERPAWKSLLDVIQPGDTIVIDSLDRLGRNYDLVTSEWRRLTREIGVDIKALDLDFMDSAAFRTLGSIGRVMEDNILSLLAYVAQTEREKIKTRQKEGIEIAKREGKYRGRLKQHSDTDLLTASQMLSEGKPKTEVASFLDVDRDTIYRMLKDGRLCASTM